MIGDGLRSHLILKDRPHQHGSIHLPPFQIAQGPAQSLRPGSRIHHNSAISLFFQLRLDIIGPFHMMQVSYICNQYAYQFRRPVYKPSGRFIRCIMMLLQQFQYPIARLFIDSGFPVDDARNRTGRNIGFPSDIIDRHSISPRPHNIQALFGPPEYSLLFLLLYNRFFDYAIGFYASVFTRDSVKPLFLLSPPSPPSPKQVPTPSSFPLNH